jgi:hypothetical protein
VQADIRVRQMLVAIADRDRLIPVMKEVEAATN